MDYLNYLIYAIIAWNVFVFAMYGADKRKAKKGNRRISEKTLLTTAFFMGSVGAIFGMTVFRHKTKHWKFKILLPLFVIIHIAAAVAVYWFIIAKK